MDPHTFTTNSYPNGIRLKVQFTIVRDHVVEGTYYYEQIRDWEYVSKFISVTSILKCELSTRWPLRIACPLRPNQTAFEGPLEVRRLEWGADYPPWHPADIAKRSLEYRCEKEDTFEQREENALKLAAEMRQNDPTLRSRPPVMASPPNARSPLPVPSKKHWLDDARLLDFRFEILYKVIETAPRAGPSKRKRMMDDEHDSIRIVATVGTNPSGRIPSYVILRCANQTLQPQKKSVLDATLCEPLHPGGRFGRNYRLYAFRGPHEGEFMRPVAHQLDADNKLMHMGIWVHAQPGIKDCAHMIDGKRQTIVFRDEDCVLVKDTKDETMHNHEWETIRTRGRL